MLTDASRFSLLHLQSFTGHPSPIRSRVEEQDESHPGYLQNVYDGIRQVLDLGISYFIISCRTSKKIQVLLNRCPH